MPARMWAVTACAMRRRPRGRLSEPQGLRSDEPEESAASLRAALASLAA